VDTSPYNRPLRRQWAWWAYLGPLAVPTPASQRARGGGGVILRIGPPPPRVSNGPPRSWAHWAAREGWDRAACNPFRPMGLFGRRGEAGGAACSPLSPLLRNPTGPWGWRLDSENRATTPMGPVSSSLSSLPPMIKYGLTK